MPPKLSGAQNKKKAVAREKEDKRCSSFLSTWLASTSSVDGDFGGNQNHKDTNEDEKNVDENVKEVDAAEESKREEEMTVVERKTTAPEDEELATTKLPATYDDPVFGLPKERLEKTARLLRGPYQPSIPNFPKTVIGKGINSRKRSFNSLWYKDYKWLEYSIEKDAAFCFPCRCFALSDIKHGTGSISDAFTKNGFSQWHKGKECFQQHEQSNCHTSSAQAFEYTLKSTPVDYQLDKAKQEEIKEKEKKKEKNHQYMARLVDVVRTLAKGGKPLRGHDESEDSIERGLFLEIVKLLQKYDPFFKSYLESSSKNCTYLSNRIQNDILTALCNVMLRKIGEELKGQPLSIVADETSDVRHTEQMAIVFRYIPVNDTLPLERFIDIERLEKTDAETIFKTLENLLSKMGIMWKDVVSVCFDGASNMAGEFTGVQARCKEVNENILYVHCYAHCLNLALVNTCTNHAENPIVFDFFGTIQVIYSFIEGSSKRHAVFENIVKSTDIKLKTLKTLSETRWACRAEAVAIIHDQFMSVVNAIEDIVEDASDAKARAKGRGILSQVKSFDFIISLEILNPVLNLILITSKTLQSSDIDLCQAIENVESLAMALIELRNDTNKFETMFKSATDLCKEMDITIPIPKKRKVSSRIDDGNPDSAYHVDSKYEEIRLFTFYPLLDKMVEGLNDRFNQETKDIINIVGKTVKLCLGDYHCTSKEYQRVSEVFGIDAGLLEAEILLLKNRKSNSDSDYPPKSVTQWLEWLSKQQRFATYSNFNCLLRKFSSIPVASCSCERSFSKLTIVKSKLRSTMTQNRLQSLMLPFIEQDLCMSISVEEVINEFKNIVSFDRRLLL